MFAASKTNSFVAVNNYEISRSLRFNRPDTAYLNRTPASAGNRSTWTFSTWVKRNSLDNIQTIFSAGPLTTTNYLVALFFFDNNLDLAMYGSGGSQNGRIITSAVYRDVSAWYHVMAVVDSTQATASNRLKLYVNGVQVTAFSSATYPAQNDIFNVNATVPHFIGTYSYDTTLHYISCNQTETYLIDGQALTPSSFGETNAQTGVWQPKAFSGGAYGTNGFYLNFSDNSNTTAATLGKDYSGNGNNWTPNNFSVTAGAGNDSLVDVPTPYGVDTGAGGTVRGNYATFNPLTTSRTISNGNLYTEVNGGGGSNVPISLSMALPTTGKWYWEITAGGPAGGGNGGWDWGIVASSTPNFRLANLLVAGTTGCYGVNGNSGTLVANATTAVAGYISGGIANGDVAQIAYDADTGKLWLGKNNTWGSNGGVGNPAAGTNAGITSLSGEFIPVFEYASDSGTISATLNTGQRAFAYTAPSGFKALCTQNLPTPTIGATTATQAGKFFNPVLYTGNGSTNAITGVGFAPDLVWIKSRSAAYNNRLYDQLRGVQNVLQSNSTAAESSDGTGLTAFGSDGFTLGSSVSQNENTTSFVSWNWKANGTGVTNTSGTVTSTVSANTTSGFSVATWTGSSAGQTVGHGLGVAPSLIIAKTRSASGENWPVYHKDLGVGAYLFLSSDAGANTTYPTYWGSSAPTSTVFGTFTGGYPAANNYGSMVAYCFAPIAGYSAFGSYTGNGSADGPFVFTGMRPAFVLIKKSSSTGYWVIFDVVRNSYNIMTSQLWPNASDAENSTQSVIDFVSNGFKLRNTGAGYNDNGSIYIYMALASNPFKYSLAR